MDTRGSNFDENYPSKWLTFACNSTLPGYPVNTTALLHTFPIDGIVLQLLARLVAALKLSSHACCGIDGRVGPQSARSSTRTGPLASPDNHSTTTGSWLRGWLSRLVGPSAPRPLCAAMHPPNEKVPVVGSAAWYKGSIADRLDSAADAMKRAYRREWHAFFRGGVRLAQCFPLIVGHGLRFYEAVGTGMKLSEASSADRSIRLRQRF